MQENPVPNSFHSISEFVSGCLLLIDKPLGWTSFDALNKIKGFVKHNIVIPPNEQGHNQRFKIGHAGTLDPLATGLLVICTGKLTKSIDRLQSGEKEYTGTIRFGSTTPSYDLETEPEGDYRFDHIEEADLRNAASSFLGEILQTPPSFSAKQVNGQRAYNAARKGVEIKIPAVAVEVKTFEITNIAMPDVDFRIVCSKGTYIRSLAHELGQRLNSGSHLISLRRTSSKPFNINDSIKIEELTSRLMALSAESPSESPAKSGI